MSIRNRRSLKHFGWNQQISTYSLDCPQWIDRGECTLIEFPLQVKNGFLGVPVHVINNSDLYINEYKHLLINMSLEAAAANEKWHTDIDELYFFTTLTIQPRFEIKEEEVPEAKTDKEMFITGMVAFQQCGIGIKLRYAWLHPFNRGNGLLRSFLNFRMTGSPIIVDPPVTPSMERCLQSVMRRFFEETIEYIQQCASEKDEIPKEFKEHIMSHLNYWEDLEPVNARSYSQTIKVIKLIKSLISEELDPSSAMELIRGLVF